MWTISKSSIAFSDRIHKYSIRFYSCFHKKKCGIWVIAIPVQRNLCRCIFFILKSTDAFLDRGTTFQLYFNVWKLNWKLSKVFHQLCHTKGNIFDYFGKHCLFSLGYRRTTVCTKTKNNRISHKYELKIHFQALPGIT